jgi:Protein of unknown function (DUF4232)
MKTTPLTLSALALLAAGCGAQAAAHPTATRGGSQPARIVAVASTGSTARCTAHQLSVRLGTAGHAAGSTYRPIVFTNTGSSPCTLRGYPGVSYVAPKTGAQVGAPATRDTGVAPTTVTLAPRGHAAALLQLVNYINYPASDCKAKPVSGLRVYPPGSRAAKYVAFAQNTKACSSDADQLTVRAVVKGRSGQ